jgi:hypothetical protein
MCWGRFFSQDDLILGEENTPYKHMKQTPPCDRRPIIQHSNMKEVEKLTTTISKQQSASGSQAKQNAAFSVKEECPKVILYLLSCLLVPLSFFKQWSISYSKQENYMLL